MTSQRIVLHFPHRLVDQPIVYRLVKEFNLSFNILKASVTPQEEGLMILELSGSDEDFKRAAGVTSDEGVSAAQNQAQQPHAEARGNSQDVTEPAFCDDVQGLAEQCTAGMGDIRLERMTSSV